MHTKSSRSWRNTAGTGAVRLLLEAERELARRGYRALGKAYFAHGNSGRAPAHALGEDIRRDIADLCLGQIFFLTFGREQATCFAVEKILGDIIFFGNKQPGAAARQLS
jgi:hypothetical protein